MATSIQEQIASMYVDVYKLIPDFGASGVYYQSIPLPGRYHITAAHLAADAIHSQEDAREYILAIQELIHRLRAQVRFWRRAVFSRTDTGNREPITHHNLTVQQISVLVNFAYECEHDLNLKQYMEKVGQPGRLFDTLENFRIITKRIRDKLHDMDYEIQKYLKSDQSVSKLFRVCSKLFFTISKNCALENQGPTTRYEMIACTKSPVYVTDRIAYNSPFCQTMQLHHELDREIRATFFVILKLTNTLWRFHKDHDKHGVKDYD